MTIPFHRLAWIAAALFAPAAVVGWLTVAFPGMVKTYYMWLTVAILAGLVITPLSWSDHSGTDHRKSWLGCAGMFVALVGACSVMWRVEAEWLIWPLSITLTYLVPTLVVALANPEGMTLLLVLVNMFVATGLAEGMTRDAHLAVGLTASGLAFALGLGCSLLRRAARA